MFWILPMRRVKIAYQTIRGLLTLADVLGTIGFWLYRGTMKRTIGIAIALLTIFIFGQKSDKFDVSFSTVIGGTGLILIISCIGGAGGRVNPCQIPKLWSNRNPRKGRLGGGDLR